MATQDARWSVILRGSLRSYLRMTAEKNGYCEACPRAFSQALGFDPLT